MSRGPVLSDITSPNGPVNDRFSIATGPFNDKVTSFLSHVSLQASSVGAVIGLVPITVIAEPTARLLVTGVKGVLRRVLSGVSHLSAVDCTFSSAPSVHLLSPASVTPEIYSSGV